MPTKEKQTQTQTQTQTEKDKPAITKNDLIKAAIMFLFGVVLTSGLGFIKDIFSSPQEIKKLTKQVEDLGKLIDKQNNLIEGVSKKVDTINNEKLRDLNDLRKDGDTALDRRLIIIEQKVK